MLTAILVVLGLIVLTGAVIGLLSVAVAVICLPFAAVWCWIDNRRRARLPAG